MQLQLANDDLFGTARPVKENWKKLGSSGFLPRPKMAAPVIPLPKAGSRRVVTVDSFAGGGGASNGVELALETLQTLGLLPEGHSSHVDFAVNHDEPALAMHAVNHPRTVHLPHNVWKVNMRDLLGDDLFGLLWLSPDCRDHSPAKGGPITSRSVRDLAWVLVRWLKELPDWQRPHAIFLENVPAFSKWSPLIPTEDGEYQRDKDREGEIFYRFMMAVVGFGYSAGWKEVMACDHGDPTIRNRLYIVFRRDGEEIDWPEATHGDPRSDDVAQGLLDPWPVAADIVDFDIPCPSIFLTKEEAAIYTKKTGKRIIRPLAEKTDRRLAKGVKRHVVDEAEPFIATCNHDGEGFRGQSLDKPFRTVASARDAHGLVLPNLMAYYGEGRGSTDRSASLLDPLHVVPTENRHALVETLIAPHVVSFRGDQIGRSMRAALGAVTANSYVKRPGGASPVGLASTMLAPIGTYGQHGGRSRSLLQPYHTVKASTKDQNQIAQAEFAPFLVPRYGERDGQEPRTHRIDAPYPTAVPTGNGGSFAAVYMAQHNGGPRGPIGRSARDPMATTMHAGSQQAVVAAHFLKRDFGNSIGSSMKNAVGTVTAGGGGKTQLVSAHMMSLKGSTRRANSMLASHPAVCASGQHSAVITLPLMTAYYSTGGQDASIGSPMLAVPTKARFGMTEVDAAPQPLTDEQLARARQVADFLRKYDCWDDREFVTIEIYGITFILIDIGMRMLTPRELARAQGFPDSYILAAPYKGGVLSETAQRHKIGNSVCRRPAAAIIIQNYRPPLDWIARTEPMLEAAE